MRRFVTIAVVLLLLVAGAIGLAASQSSTSMPQMTLAARVGCYGDWCSGRDPQSTGCSADGQTVASTTVTYTELTPGVDPPSREIEVGWLDLRWSPTCKTNWSRLTLYGSAPFSEVVVTQDTGYTQSYRTTGWTGRSGVGTYWTNMIYSPHRAAYSSITCSNLPGCPKWRTRWI